MRLRTLKHIQDSDPSLAGSRGFYSPCRFGVQLSMESQICSILSQYGFRSQSHWNMRDTHLSSVPLGLGFPPFTCPAGTCELNTPSLLLSAEVKRAVPPKEEGTRLLQNLHNAAAVSHTHGVETPKHLLCGLNPQTLIKHSTLTLKEISPGCSLEGLMLKLKLPILRPPDAKS